MGGKNYHNTGNVIHVPLGGLLNRHTHQQLVKIQWYELVSMMNILFNTTELSNTIEVHTSLAGLFRGDQGVFTYME